MYTMNHLIQIKLLPKKKNAAKTHQLAEWGMSGMIRTTALSVQSVWPKYYYGYKEACAKVTDLIPPGCGRGEVLRDGAFKIWLKFAKCTPGVKLQMQHTQRVR